jgi:hypothetical protein
MGSIYNCTYVRSTRTTTGEPRFPECRTLPRVPKIGHSGKQIFPECCTRGRKALGEERLSRVPQNPWHSGKDDSWRRVALTKGNSHLTTPLDGTVCQKNEKCLPRVPCSSTRGRWPLPRVPRGSTRGNIFIFLVVLLYFLVMPCHII